MVYNKNWKDFVINRYIMKYVCLTSASQIFMKKFLSNFLRLIIRVQIFKEVGGKKINLKFFLTLLSFLKLI